MSEQGNNKLEDLIEKYLPANIKVPEYSGCKITLEDLATHTSRVAETSPNIWVHIPV